MMFKTFVIASAVLGQLAVATPEDILPPVLPWSGRSGEVVVPNTDPWITPAERSGFRLSPSYDETVAWLRRLVAASPELRMVSIGRSPEGRDLWMIIASRERAFTPEAMRRSGKPLVFAQGGIHSGEIDGKDAGLMLLRDMTVRRTRRALLDHASFLFVPILNVDGHERSSRYSRINQRGPEVMGWRTNAQNLNLNRDYTKLDTPEMRATIAALDRWQPDLYLDLHVTDGSDYQYDITFGWSTSGWSPAITRWLENELSPALHRDLTNMGHIPGPLVFPIRNGDDPALGIALGNSTARFSSGYGDARHLPMVLVENHSLKPYDQRVLGTYVLLVSALETAGRAADSLRRAVAEDRRPRSGAVPLAWELSEKGPVTTTIDFRAMESRRTLSPISGAVRQEWLGRPVTIRVPVYDSPPLQASVSRPAAYWIPAAWNEIAERLRMHGIAMEQIAAPREIDVECYRLVDPKLSTSAFEGHVRLDSLSVRSERRRERFPAGSWRVATDQPLGTLAMVLLEPLSPDSFLQWGFFHSILQRTEYGEAYALESLAERMLASSPELAAEFQRRLSVDEAFRASATERLRWFYEQTPFRDERWLLYPVARE